MNKKALVVDDDPIILLFLSSILEAYGFEVYTGEDGVAAVMMFEETEPSLVIIDMHMPKMNGCAAARAIRELTNGDECYIILYTSELQEDLVRCNKCDDVDCIINKSNLSELKRRVSRFINQLSMVS